jgi:hypothetical protein
MFELYEVGEPMSEPSTTWQEAVAAGEDAVLEAIAAELASIQKDRDSAQTEKHRYPMFEPVKHGA